VIEKTLENAGRRVFTNKDILKLLNENREKWGALANVAAVDLLEHLLVQTPLKRITLRAEAHEREFVRFLWRAPSVFEVAASLRSSAYLCHSSAVYLHRLTPESPKDIYLNAEQSVKPKPGSGLSQEGIDRAFQGKQRCSAFAFKFESTRIVLLNGKNTNCFGVEERLIEGQQHRLRMTSLERTLIDIAVRSAYAGGVRSVVQAYGAALPRVSIAKLTSTLGALDYVYPYHQAIGFYLARAGCSANELAPLKALGLHWNFYLAHNMRETQYDSDWKLYYPKNL
jgi:hypothetical protein